MINKRNKKKRTFLKKEKTSKKTEKEKNSSDLKFHKTKIRVIGIGGGGGNIISEIASQVKKIDFVAVNTDIQALKSLPRTLKKFVFGEHLTKGLGCGMDPKLGAKCAQEEKEKIKKLFKGIDLAIIVASLGGGTGSGASPEFLKIAKELGVKTFGIFTLPFKFEKGKKLQIAKASIERMRPDLNILIEIPNDNIFKIINQNTPLIHAFSEINKRLAENLLGLIEMIYLPGIINIDFADLTTILEGKGKDGFLSSRVGYGPHRAEEVVKKILEDPLVDYNFEEVERILFNITSSKDLKIKEVQYISEKISGFNLKGKIIFGISENQFYKDKIRLTVLMVGKKKKERKQKQQKKEENKISKKTKRKKKKKLPSQEKVTFFSSSQKTKKEPKIERRNALEIKKAMEETEKEILEEEKKWEVPAFLRRKT